MLTPGLNYPGTSLRIEVQFADASGTAIDPDTVTFKTYSPCGQSVTYVYDTDAEVGRSAAGAYYADIEPGEAGVWFFRWETTGTGTVFATEGRFNVQRSPFVDNCCSDYC